LKTPSKEKKIVKGLF